jgi:hypothetical protein
MLSENARIDRPSMRIELQVSGFVLLKALLLNLKDSFALCIYLLNNTA